MKRFIAMLLVVLTLVAAIPFSAAAAEVNPETGMPFKDVKANHWFYNAVKYTYDAGIFSANNSAGDMFAPNASMTRAMFVTVLFRLSGVDQSTYTGKTAFTDVPVNQWYAKAVQWANEKNYVAGMTETTFNPNGSITRAQMARILSLYAAGEDNYDLTDVRATAFDKFGDASKVQDWAKEGITWMSTTGLINGMGTENGAPILNPNGNATRAQAAQILMSYKELRYNAETAVGDIMIGDTSISEYTIVYGTTATISGQNASVCANELQSYVKKVTGFDLPIYKDTAREIGEKEILIGKTNREGVTVNVDRTGFNYDTLLIEVQNGNLILASNEEHSGTHYAVYEFLEQYAGVTFYGFLETYAPKNVYTVPADLRYTETTTINYRDYIFSKGTYSYGDQKLRQGVGSFSQSSFYHSMPALGQDPADFQPNWGYYANHHMDDDPCLTDPQVQQNIITNVKTQLKGRRANSFVWVAMSDSVYYCKGGAKCQCDEFYREHGRTSTYFNILNLVGKAIKEEYPDMYVVSLAYKYTWNLPKNFDPADTSDNVIVCVCTDNACATHDHTETNCVGKGAFNSVKYAEIFDEWCRLVPNVWVWDYTSGTYQADAPFPIIHQMYKNYQDFHDRGVSGILVLGEGSDCAPFTELKAYLTSKLVWETDMTEAQYWTYVDNFLRDYYGDGWTYLREYIDYMYELQYENEWHIWSMEYWDAIITYEQYTENFDYLMGLWEKAEALAYTDEQKLRVRRSATQMKYIEVCLAYETWERSGSEADLEAFKAINIAYGEYLDTLGHCRFKLPYNWRVDSDPKLWVNNSKDCWDGGDSSQGTVCPCREVDENGKPVSGCTCG
ncbi:MAG: DUF4838 domain-containing protein [Clostridia bacterium]|nr:DUF4838 domain-containing protein [Clostridia bacterium]